MKGDGTAKGYRPTAYFAELACSVTRLLVNMTTKTFNVCWLYSHWH